MMETALRKQLKTLNGKLRAVTEQARQQPALQKKTQRWQNKKKKDIEDVSFILFVRAAPDASTALWYAAREAAATGLPIEITEAALETRCLNTDVNTLATISKGSGGMAKGLLATADRVHKEHDLRGSIQHQNDLKGVAPTTALVLKHLAKMHEDQKKTWHKWAPKRQKATAPSGCNASAIETVCGKVVSPPESACNGRP